VRPSRKSALALVLLVTSFPGEQTAARAQEPKPGAGVGVGDKARLTQLIRHSVDFFDASYHKDSGSYFSDVGHDGKPLTDRRHVVPSGRMLYALAHASEIDPKYKGRALGLRDYLLGTMTANEAGVGPYFRGAVNGSGKEVVRHWDKDARKALWPEQANPDLKVNEQAYGLCGLVALYAVDPTPDGLRRIDEYYRAFRARFKDRGRGRTGFFSRYGLPGAASPGPNATKNFDSTVYVGTAFLLELHAAAARVAAAPGVDAGHRDLAAAVRDTAAADLTELADAVADRMADAADKTGFLVEHFDAEWKPAWPDDRKADGDTIGVVGHNFQAAWFLLRASELPAAKQSGRGATYAAKAAGILTSMLARGEGRPVDFRRGGFRNGFLRAGGTMFGGWGGNKHWWQQAEGILALTLAERLKVRTTPDAAEVRDRAFQFFVDHFVDRQQGGEFDEVQEDGRRVVGEDMQPVDRPKGHAGKSAYHTVELYRYLIRYADPR